jgi:hypothetical protein
VWGGGGVNIEPPTAYYYAIRSYPIYLNPIYLNPIYLTAQLGRPVTLDSW